MITHLKGRMLGVTFSMRGSMAAAALSKPRSAGALPSLTVLPSTSRTRFALTNKTKISTPRTAGRKTQTVSRCIECRV